MDKVPPQHRAFVGELAEKHHFSLPPERPDSDAPAPFDPNLALAMLDVAFRHPIKLIANALGVPPQAMIDMGRERGVPVAALVGAKEQPCGRWTQASTFWWCRAARPAAIAARFLPWCWCPR